MDGPDVSDFFGNFFLALLLSGLARVLYAVSAALIRTRDGGNILFAIALPAALLYIAVSNPVPIGDWAGFASGLAVGAAAILLSSLRKAG